MRVTQNLSNTWATLGVEKNVDWKWQAKQRKNIKISSWEEKKRKTKKIQDKTLLRYQKFRKVALLSHAAYCIQNEANFWQLLQFMFSGLSFWCRKGLQKYFQSVHRLYVTYCIRYVDLVLIVDVLVHQIP